MYLDVLNNIKCKRLLSKIGRDSFTLSTKTYARIIVGFVGYLFKSSAKSNTILCKKRGAIGKIDTTANYIT
jgi:hypothetical protein